MIFTSFYADLNEKKYYFIAKKYCILVIRIIINANYKKISKINI